MTSNKSSQLQKVLTDSPPENDSLELFPDSPTTDPLVSSHRTEATDSTVVSHDYALPPESQTQWQPQHYQNGSANGYASPASPVGSPRGSNFTSTAKVYKKVPRREGTLLDTDVTCIPPITEHRSRTLVLCFDGTGDQFDNDNSNIVELFSMLKKNDKTVQMCYYQAGIGTYTGRHFTIPGVKSLSETLDAAVAWALDNHVQEGYEFLMNNYIAGDKVILFGFSRGAYTARALAGMLHKVGLLPAENKQQILFAWTMYQDVTVNGWKLSRQFKKAFCVDITIDFIGVFDTVSSVGMLGKRLPFTASNYGIRIFRHAMALDERRARFKVNHWTRSSGKHDVHPNQKKKRVRKGHEHDHEHEHTWKEVDDVETDVKEVWFAGCHCDVGGGSVANETPNCLAKIPLRWMVRETFRCKTGILWDIDALTLRGLDPDHLYPNVIVPPLGNALLSSSPDKNDTADPPKSRDGDHPEHLDAISPMYDQLSIAKGWWFLELLPTKGRKQTGPPEEVDQWEKYYFMNRGRGREFPRTKEGTLVHESVKHRLGHDGLKYKWKTLGDIEPTWVN